MERWGKYREGGMVNVRGKPYQIIYVMAHHGSNCAWLVIKQQYDPWMYEFDIDYAQGLQQQGSESDGSGKT